VNVIQSINSSNAIEPPVSLPPLPTGNVAKWIRRYAQPVMALELVSNLGENPGDLRMYVHRPSGFREGLPLVVALHGCTQSATDFDDETGAAQCALMSVRGAPCLVIAGDAACLNAWTKAAAQLDIPSIKHIARIPMDRRHVSKVDRKALQKLL
jgi:hypothetical protein